MQNINESHPPDHFHPSVCLLDAALAYAHKGLRVFPLHSIASTGDCSCGRAKCRSIGKHPRTLNGVKDATDDPETIVQWWNRYPAANIGIATGKGLLVINIDPYRGSMLDDFRQFFALPETSLVQTGAGGWHLYYRYHTTFVLRNTLGKLGPGVDSKAEGGYVVAPPSNHLTGIRYRWLNTREPVFVPTVLLPALINAKSGSAAYKRVALSTASQSAEQALQDLAEILLLKPAQAPQLFPKPYLKIVL